MTDKSRIRAHIIQALREIGDYASPHDIADHIGHPVQTTRTACRAILRDGKLDSHPYRNALVYGLPGWAVTREQPGEDAEAAAECEQNANTQPPAPPSATRPSACAPSWRS